MLSALHLFHDVIENIISLLFHNASNFQQIQKKQKTFLITCKCKRVSQVKDMLMYYGSVRALITNAIK